MPGANPFTIIVKIGTKIKGQLDRREGHPGGCHESCRDRISKIPS